MPDQELLLKTMIIVREDRLLFPFERPAKRQRSSEFELNNRCGVTEFDGFNLVRSCWGSRSRKQRFGHGIYMR